MSVREHARRSPVAVLRAAVLVALVAALAYQAIGAAAFLPQFANEDPRVVVTAYYRAEQWGYRAIAERALSRDLREQNHSPNMVTGWVDDALWSRGLEVTEAHDIPLRNEHAEEIQIVVTYTSVWRSTIGDPPGQRLWFVYVGRNPGEPWRILSQGTGP